MVVPVRTPPVKYDTFTLRGGLDLITPTLSLAPGVARDAQNFEVSTTGGYSRIAGYERFDGRTSPNAASFASLALSSVVGLATGDTLRNLAGTVTGVVIAIDGLNVFYTKAVGVFTAGITAYVGATPIGTITSVGAVAPTALQLATYSSLAADVYRADIQAVPGSGPIRGVAYLNNVVYAWRNNTGGTAKAIYRSSSTGWQAVPLGFELPFTGTGSTPIVAGDAVTNNAATATGVVARVVVDNGAAWPSSVGRLILSSTTGTWASGDQIRVGGSHQANATGAATAITIPANGRVETVTANFGGTGATPRLYGADGVGRGFEFDGTVYVPIRTTMANDAPSRVAAHKNYLFFSFGPSVQNSAVGSPYVWSPVLGANEIVMPEDVTCFLSLPGSEDTGSLAIYTRNTTHVLYGTTASNWNMVLFDNSTGAFSHTTQTLVDGYGLDDRGVVALSTTRSFGNFDSATLTFPLRPFTAARRGLATASGVSREKSQYRVFYSDGYALFSTIANGRLLGTMPIYFPNPVRCWTSGEASSGAEVSFFGSDNGFVYQMEIGPDFDGAAVTAFITLNFNPQGNARVLKRYRRAALEISGTGYAQFNFGYTLAYASTAIDQASSTPYTIAFSGAFWDTFVWDAFLWDGVTLSPSDVNCDGTGENIAVAITTNSRLNQPFTINSVTLHYSPRRGIR